jgi:hypothetical protein
VHSLQQQSLPPQQQDEFAAPKHGEARRALLWSGADDEDIPVEGSAGHYSSSRPRSGLLQPLQQQQDLIVLDGLRLQRSGSNSIGVSIGRQSSCNHRDAFLPGDGLDLGASAPEAILHQGSGQLLSGGLARECDSHHYQQQQQQQQQQQLRLKRGRSSSGAGMGGADEQQQLRMVPQEGLQPSGLARVSSSKSGVLESVQPLARSSSPPGWQEQQKQQHQNGTGGLSSSRDLAGLHQQKAGSFLTAGGSNAHGWGQRGLGANLQSPWEEAGQLEDSWGLGAGVSGGLGSGGLGHVLAGEGLGQLGQPPGLGESPWAEGFATADPLVVADEIHELNGFLGVGDDQDLAQVAGQGPLGLGVGTGQVLAVSPPKQQQAFEGRPREQYRSHKLEKGVQNGLAGGLLVQPQPQLQQAKRRRTTGPSGNIGAIAAAAAGGGRGGGAPVAAAGGSMAGAVQSTSSSSGAAAAEGPHRSLPRAQNNQSGAKAMASTSAGHGQPVVRGQHSLVRVPAHKSHHGRGGLGSGKGQGGSGDGGGSDASKDHQQQKQQKQQQHGHAQHHQKQQKGGKGSGPFSNLGANVTQQQEQQQQDARMDRLQLLSNQNISAAAAAIALAVAAEVGEAPGSTGGGAVEAACTSEAPAATATTAGAVPGAGARKGKGSKAGAGRGEGGRGRVRKYKSLGGVGQGGGGDGVLASGAAGVGPGGAPASTAPPAMRGEHMAHKQHKGYALHHRFLIKQTRCLQ